MIEEFEISNFKKFKQLKFDKLSRINIFAGHNNTGKSSILEAILVFFDRQSPDASSRFQGFRGVVPIVDSKTPIWESLFHNFSTEHQIKLQMKIDNDIWKTHIKCTIDGPLPDKLKSLSSKVEGYEDISSLAISSDKTKNFLLETSYFKGSTLKKKNSLSTFNNNNYFSTTHNLPLVHVDLLLTNILDLKSQNPEMLVEFIIDNNVDFIVNALKLIEPNLLDLSVLPYHNQKLIYCDIKGQSKKVPINFMGDGISKFLAIILRIVKVNNGIVCIDEIENGIHYSNFQKVWGFIDELAQQYNCQLFITTHSQDALNGLALHIDSEVGVKNAVSYYRIDADGEKSVVTHYPAPIFASSILDEWEIR